MLRYDIVETIVGVFIGGLVLLLCVALVTGVEASSAAPVYDYTRLRQEMLSEISALKVRVKSLEALTEQPGVIRTYTIDTAAGTITCRSCKFTEEKEK